MVEKFNALGTRGRDCPVCFRADSLLLARDGSGLLECGDAEARQIFERPTGCAARFRVEGTELVRARTPNARPLALEDLDRVRGGE